MQDGGMGGQIGKIEPIGQVPFNALEIPPRVPESRGNEGNRIHLHGRIQIKGSFPDTFPNGRGDSSIFFGQIDPDIPQNSGCAGEPVARLPFFFGKELLFCRRKRRNRPRYPDFAFPAGLLAPADGFDRLPRRPGAIQNIASGVDVNTAAGRLKDNSELLMFQDHPAPEPSSYL
jgi:hypothetical protein